MTNISDMVKDFQQQLQGRIGTSLMKPIAATIGRPTDDAVFANDTNRSAEVEVYIHLVTSEDPTSYTTALRGAFKRDDLKNGRPVTVVVNDAGDYVLYDVDSTRDAEYSVGIDQLDNAKPVYLKQVMEIGSLHPVAGSLKFRATSGMFGEDYYSGADSADFSTGTVQDTTPANITIPTTNGQAKGVLVQLDATTGTLEYKQSSEFPAILSLAQAYKAGLLPLPDATRYRLGYLKLVTGITQFSYDHIWEAPELLSKGSGILNNFAATVAPTANDDSGDSYAVGSLWVDVTGGKAYICEDATLTAAVWIEIVGTTLTQTLTNKTLTAPIIADFTNANHDHLDADDGGTLSASAIASGTLAHERGGLEADVSAYSGLLKITGGATSAVTAPTGAIVGDTDTQNLSNKIFTDQVLIDGSADEIQLRVQGDSSQSAYLVSIEDSAASPLFRVGFAGSFEAIGSGDIDGNLAVGTNVFDVDSNDGKVGIGTGSSITGDYLLKLASTEGALGLPSMTTAERLALTPLQNMVVYDTDYGLPFAYTGAGWQPLGFGADGIPFVNPLGFSWTALNQTSGQYDDTTDNRLKAQCAGSGTVQLRGWYTSLAAPFDYRFHVKFFNSNVNANGMAIGFRQNSTGEIHHIAFVNKATTLQPQYIVRKWNSATSHNSDYIGLTDITMHVNWIRLLDNNGSARAIYISEDGTNWQQLHTIGRTDFLTADEIFFGLHFGNVASTDDAQAVLLSMEDIS